MHAKVVFFGDSCTPSPTSVGNVALRFIQNLHLHQNHLKRTVVAQRQGVARTAADDVMTVAYTRFKVLQR